MTKSSKYLIFGSVFGLFLASFAIYSSYNNHSVLKPNYDSCSGQALYGFPIENLSNGKKDVTVICRKAYVLMHDNTAKIPVWVTYTLTSGHSIGCLKRNNQFAADSLLKKGYRSELSDYKNSNYDKGHIANDEDMSWDKDVQKESFLLSNIVPQLPNFNRGIWKDLEQNIRIWAHNRNADITIYSGPIYNIHSDKKIGNNVIVPNKFYKIIIDDKNRETIAFIFPHLSDLKYQDLEKYQVTVHDVEQLTGITFRIPDNKYKINKIWKIDSKAYYLAKKSKCKI